MRPEEVPSTNTEDSIAIQWIRTQHQDPLLKISAMIDRSLEVTVLCCDPPFSPCWPQSRKMNTIYHALLSLTARVTSLADTPTPHFHSSTQSFWPTMALGLRALSPRLPPAAPNKRPEDRIIGQNFMGYMLRIETEETTELGCRNCGSHWADSKLRPVHCDRQCSSPANGGESRIFYQPVPPSSAPLAPPLPEFRTGSANGRSGPQTQHVPQGNRYPLDDFEFDFKLSTGLLDQASHPTHEIQDIAKQPHRQTRVGTEPHSRPGPRQREKGAQNTEAQQADQNSKAQKADQCCIQIATSRAGVGQSQHKWYLS